MGCFRMMCLLTGLPIEEGEEAIFVPIIKKEKVNEMETFCYVDDKWKMELPIIEGIYDDYGNLELKESEYLKTVEKHLLKNYYFKGQAQELSDGIDRSNLKLEFKKEDFDLIPFGMQNENFSLRALINACSGSRIELKIEKKNIKYSFVQKEGFLSGFFVKKSVVEKYIKAKEIYSEQEYQKNDFYISNLEFEKEYEYFKAIKQAAAELHRPLIPAVYGSQWSDLDILKLVRDEYENFIKQNEEDEDE